MDRKQQEQLNYQLVKLLNGALRPEDMAALRERLLSDPEALDHYIRFNTIHAGMAQTCIHTEDLPLPDLPSDDTVESHAEVLEEPVVAPRRLWRWVAAAAAVLIVSSWFLTKPLVDHPPTPSGPPSAKLIGVHQATWASWTRGGFAEDKLRAGEWHLKSGLARIKLLAGTEVILHAPTRFALDEHNALTLHTGRLWAHIPRGAEGFSVTTEGAHLVDYGTEFGVVAGLDGQTEAHVFSGSVGIRPAASVDNFEHRLTQGQAAVMDRVGIMFPTKRANAKHFVSDLSQIRHQALPGQTLDLADLVGGGNGYGTGRLDIGIDPGTGSIIKEAFSERCQDEECRYHILEDNHYVDGVFVPDYSKGLNIISSTHLAFDNCPDTDGSYYDGIFNGAKMSVGSTRRFHLGQLEGQAYGTSMHPAINMHTNAGITFNLDAVRSHNPGTRIKRFKTLCGLSETLPKDPEGQAAFWVLVDGEVRFHFVCTPEETTRPVSLPIGQDDQFLTLVTTTVGNAAYGWSFFAEPVLTLKTL